MGPLHGRSCSSCGSAELLGGGELVDDLPMPAVVILLTARASPIQAPPPTAESPAVIAAPALGLQKQGLLPKPPRRMSNFWSFLLSSREVYSNLGVVYVQLGRHEGRRARRPGRSRRQPAEVSGLLQPGAGARSSLGARRRPWLIWRRS